ncbi:asm4p [Saccharomyces arboricola H-6]|uniref:Asm4p n=1 Tax=Saccharomyces arboricola (strain H-6 / AS 2.3317 / CBS 10644) TaxID=1160507 RepID=J8PQC1_SACAR|nr:asm4p [Saccharomyces arboricola H-6]
MFGVHSRINNSGFPNLTSQPLHTSQMFQSQPQPQQQSQPQQQRPLQESFGTASSQFGTSFSSNININNNSTNINSSINSSNNTNQQSRENNLSWVNNPKKRSTPHTVIRRKTTKQNSSSDTNQNDDSSSINITMRSLSKQNQDSKKNEGNTPAAYMNSLLPNFNDAPPTVTLQDWQREDEFGSVPLLTQFVSNRYTAKKPDNPAHDSKNTPNVFDKDSYVRIANIERNYLDSDDNTADTNNSAAHEASSKSSNLSAIIVFGYPESISNEVIKHFSHFGHIMEDFQVLRLGRGISPSSFRIFQKDDTSSNRNDSTNNKAITLKGRDNESTNRKYPIFTGESWVKLTYNSPSSALRALQENGTIFHGALIGCIPYSKNAVEQLAGCQIDSIDDIGEFNVSLYQNSSTSSTSNTPSPSSVISTTGAFLNNVTNNSATNVNNATKLSNSKLINTPNKRLDVKDGKPLFIQNTNMNTSIPTLLQTLESKMRQQEERYKNNEPAGLIHRLNNWLFGWNDL